MPKGGFESVAHVHPGGPVAVLTNTPQGSIGQIRRAAGLSQERLARLADCSCAYVRVLERGYVPATPEDSPAYLRVLEALSVGPNIAKSRRPAGQPERLPNGRAGPR